MSIRTFVRNAGRGQLSSEWRHNDNSWLMDGDWWHVATGCNALVHFNGHSLCEPLGFLPSLFWKRTYGDNWKARCTSCHPTIEANWKHWHQPCLILPSSNTGRFSEGALLSSSQLSDAGNQKTHFSTAVVYKSLYIKRGKVSVSTSVTVGVASSVANDVNDLTSQWERGLRADEVTMTVAGLRRYGN